MGQERKKRGHLILLFTALLVIASSSLLIVNAIKRSGIRYRIVQVSLVKMKVENAEKAYLEAELHLLRSDRLTEAEKFVALRKAMDHCLQTLRKIKTQVSSRDASAILESLLANAETLGKKQGFPERSYYFFKAASDGLQRAEIACIQELESQNIFGRTWFFITNGIIFTILIVSYFNLGSNHKKELELQLLKQKQRFLASFAYSNDAFILLDAQRRVIHRSDSIRNVLGYKKEEMTEPILELLHPDDVAAGQEEMERLFVNPAVIVRKILRVKHYDGSYHRVEIIARNLLHDPQVNAIIINLHNVNSFLEAEDKLRESEKRFRLVAENMRDIVSIHNESGAYTYISPSVGEMLGYLPEELLGRSPIHICHPEDRERMLDSYESISRGGYQKPLELRLRHKQNYYVWVETLTRPFFDEKGKLTGFQSDTRDISEQKMLEQELRFQATLLDQMSESVIATNSQGRVIYWNKGAERIFGYSSREMTGKKTGQLFANTLPVLSSDNGGEWTEQPASGELVAIGKNKNETWLEARTSILHNEDNKLVCHIQVATDISERKASEEKVKTAYKELEQFAYATSHDLQEPLRMVNGFLKLIEKRYSDKIDEQGLEFIAFAIDGSRRMSNLIQQLLVYSRTGRSGEQLREVDLNKLLENVKLNLYQSIHESAATITVNGPLPVITGFPTQLERLFQNLIENALKYNRPGIPPEITISSQEEKGEWRFDIEDNGVGVPLHQQTRIFEPFTRAGSGEKKGSGLGLATCSKIVRLHQGHISCKAAPEHGSIFSFTLSAHIQPPRN